MTLITIISLLNIATSLLINVSQSQNISVEQKIQAITFANQASNLAIQALKDVNKYEDIPHTDNRPTNIQNANPIEKENQQQIVQTVIVEEKKQPEPVVNIISEPLGGQSQIEEQIDYGTAVLCFVEPGINCQNKTQTKDIYLSSLTLTFWNRNETSTVTIKDKDMNVISNQEIPNPNIAGINTDIKINVTLPESILLKQAQRPTVLFFQTSMGNPIRITNIKYKIDGIEHTAYQD